MQTVRNQSVRSERSLAPSAVDAWVLAGLAVAALAAFAPIFRNGFVNWDDPAVLLDNPHVGHPGIFSWAFSTTLIGHYQPLAWLVWSAMVSLFGLSAPAFHALSLAVHIVNGLLVYVLTLRLLATTTLTATARRAAASLAACAFLVHPTSVEAVAWASAWPYVLSLTALLVALLAYLNGRGITAIACYAVSLLTRASALVFPIVLLVVDIYPLARHRRTSLERLALEKVPYAVLAAAMAFAESHAREVASLQDVGLGARFTLAATATFVYFRRLVWPVRLSPLDPLPISPTIQWVPLVLAIVGLVAVTLAVYALRRTLPMLAAGWIAYVALLAPVAGLTPSGLQATADRYLYVPGIAIWIVAGTAFAGLMARRARVPTPLNALAIGVAAAVMVMLGVLTWNQTRYWSDSIALWTRTAELNPRNDVATYNLAVALAASGREDEAIGQYEETLALVPDHDLARHQLNQLQAARAEREGDRLATSGQFEQAAGQYSRALALDATRLHARAARGMALLQRGRIHEAAADLRAAVDGGVKDPEVSNGLAFALMQSGDTKQAAAILSRALDAHPDDVNLKHNLARLLATADDPAVRNAPRALALALDVCGRTDNKDPRALDTLAAAYAVNGQLDNARATASRALARARELGDEETAAEIARHAAAYR
jgi:protein O-mannosyl-transferase